MTRLHDSRLLCALLCAGAAVLAIRTTSLGDYGSFLVPVHAMLDLHLGGLGGTAGVYGASLAMRLLFVWPVDALGGSDLAVYRAGAALFVVATALIGWIVSRRAADAQRRTLLAATFVAVPAILASVSFGHPEDALGGALCVGAVVAAAEGRTALTVTALGLALANKPWALLAVPAVLAVAAAPTRIRITVGTGALAALLVAPFWLANLHDAAGGAGATATAAQGLWRPQQLFFFLGHAHHHVSGGVTYTGYQGPLLVRQLSHPLVAVLAPLLVLAFRARAGRPVTRDEALGLLGVTFLLRAALDPLDITYYAIPAVLALATWETFARPGLPVLAALTTAGTWITFEAHLPSAPARAAAYAVFVLAVLAAAAARLAPQSTRRSATATAPIATANSAISSAR